MKSLCLIIGAGASFDCVMPGTPLRGEARRKPPLTSELFSNQYDTWLDSFPKAGGLVAELRTKLMYSPSASLEGLLRIENEKKTNVARRKQLRQLPLYLRVLFNGVSYGYVRPEQTCYFTLIQLINELGFDKILVINLNYDTLFEQALEVALNLPIREIGDYFNPTRAWSVLKPHGSVNWVRRLNSIVNFPKDVKSYVSFIDRLDEFDFLDEEPKLDDTPRWFLDEKAIYPHMTIPLEGKYELCCPEEHVQFAREIIATCGVFCTIGSSLKDKDVVDDIIKISLKDRPRVLVPVTIDEGTANEKFVERIMACFGRTPDKVYKEGFSRFILAGDAASILKGIG